MRLLKRIKSIKLNHIFNLKKGFMINHLNFKNILIIVITELFLVNNKTKIKKRLKKIQKIKKNFYYQMIMKQRGTKTNLYLKKIMSIWMMKIIIITKLNREKLEIMRKFRC